MSATVLIVDDSATIRAGLAAAVRAMKLEPLVAETGERALELFSAALPALVLLDVMMPGIDGYETAKRMRAASAGKWIPILFLSSSEYDQDLERAIESGGDDYLVKPVSAVVLSAKIRALQRLEKMHNQLVDLSGELTNANRRLETISQQDALTGIANRRAFDERLALHFADAARQHEPLSLVLCDIDHFKAYNDRYGHPAGDACLRAVGGALTRCCKRATDLAARYGGEEFALILPHTPAGGALVVVAKLRADIDTLALPHEVSPTARTVSFSAGVATYSGEAGVQIPDLIRRADEALYRAKQQGRNRALSG
ncbi:MAG TPA: diguanylate cyclase [Burkholderiales bacterium]|nr:diguanylate cyclase [Burkholderiales bacterium]